MDQQQALPELAQAIQAVVGEDLLAGQVQLLQAAVAQQPLELG
jgi:hypothetical protein